MVKVSIIVPVHNSESYLHQCVESLLAQTLPQIEIILVDDCSTDGSALMIRRYQGMFPDKVRGLFLEHNIRQGGARNRGMAVAKGQYIAFVESDDFVEPDMCRALYEAAQGADLCGADYYMDFGDRLKDVDTDYGEGRKMTPGRRRHFVGHCGYFWSRIYRREFLLQHDLKFPENIFYEDAYFNFLTALYADTLVKAPGRYYHYVQSANSTIRNRNNPTQYERITVPSLILAECRRRGLWQKQKTLIQCKYMSMQMSNITYICLDKFDKPEVAQLWRIRDAIRTECPGCTRYPEYRSEPLRLRIYLRLTLLWPRLTVMAYKADRLVELLEVLEKKLKRRKRK